MEITIFNGKSTINGHFQVSLPEGKFPFCWVESLFQVVNLPLTQSLSPRRCTPQTTRAVLLAATSRIKGATFLGAPRCLVSSPMICFEIQDNDVRYENTCNMSCMNMYDMYNQAQSSQGFNAIIICARIHMFLINQDKPRKPRIRKTQQICLDPIQKVRKISAYPFFVVSDPLFRHKISWAFFWNIPCIVSKIDLAKIAALSGGACFCTFPVSPWDVLWSPNNLCDWNGFPRFSLSLSTS